MTLARRTATEIARATAAWLEQTRRRDWGRAMRAEIEHIEGDWQALRFACGCAWAAITLRSTAMDLGNLRVSRFVLALEMALCFVPLTLGWLDVLFGQSGVAWLDAAAVERYYLVNTDGVAALAKQLVGAAVGVLGPVGLIVAVRHLVLGRALHHGMLGVLLIAGPIALAVVYVAANLATDTSWSTEWAGFYVLFVALPLAGAAHLLILGRSNAAARA